MDTTLRRKRAMHEWQKISHMKSLDFALEKEEKLSRGPLTKLEFFVLENLLLHCSECDIDVTAENLSQLYRVSLTSVKEVYPPLPLYNLPHEKLEGFICLHQKLFTIFKTLCDIQLNYNADK